MNKVNSTIREQLILIYFFNSAKKIDRIICTSLYVQPNMVLSILYWRLRETKTFIFDGKIRFTELDTDKLLFSICVHQRNNHVEPIFHVTFARGANHSIILSIFIIFVQYLSVLSDASYWALLKFVGTDSSNHFYYSLVSANTCHNYLITD